MRAIVTAAILTTLLAPSAHAWRWPWERKTVKDLPTKELDYGARVTCGRVNGKSECGCLRKIGKDAGDDRYERARNGALLAQCGSIEKGNFSGWDLRNLILGDSYVAGIYLGGGHFPGVKFRDTWLNNVKFDGTVVTGADFTKADLSGSWNEGADFSNSVFVESNFGGAHFYGCRFRKATFRNLRGGFGSYAGGSDFEGADLAGNDLRGAGFSSSNFRNANLAHVRLEHSRIGSCDFRGADLTGTDIDKAYDIVGAYYDEKTKLPFGREMATKLQMIFTPGKPNVEAKNDLPGIRVSPELRLERVNLSGSNFANANFGWADLLSSNLRNADLRKASFYEASLEGSDLRGAILDETSFVWADLRGADLTGTVSWETARFETAFFDEKTKLPFSREEALRKGMTLRPSDLGNTAR